MRVADAVLLLTKLVSLSSFLSFFLPVSPPFFLLRYLLLSKATVTLMGGTTILDSLIKVVSRASPLIFAPLRIQMAFVLQYNLTRNNGNPDECEWMENPLSGGTGTPGRVGNVSASSEEDVALETNSSMQLMLTRSKNNIRVVSNRVATAVKQAVRDRADDDRAEYYKPVPLSLFALVIFPTALVCLVAMIRLATWGVCNGEPWNNSTVCLTPSYPVFGHNASCSCNVIGFIESEVSPAYCNAPSQVQQRETLAHMATHAQHTSTVIVRLGCNASIAAANVLLDESSALAVLILDIDARSNIRAVSSFEADQRGGQGLRLDLLKPALVTFQLIYVESLDLRFLSLLTNLREVIFEGRGGSTAAEEVSRTDFSRLTNLFRLRLSNCALRAVPTTLWGLTNLIRLDLNHNKLTHMPSSLGRLTNMKQIALQMNELTFLPPQIAMLQKLTMLRAYNNKLTAMPKEMNELVGLNSMDLDNNLLTSLEQLGDWWPALTYLSVRSNGLTALELGDWPALTLLDASSNSLTALELGDRPALTHLAVSSNSLTALALGHWPALTYLAVSSNGLAALKLGDWPALTLLDVSSNGLTALELGDWPSLTYLDLAHNKLSFLELGGLPAQLDFLGLHHNSLQALPPSFFQLTAMTVLELHNNQLTVIPDLIGGLTLMEKMDLSNNNLLTLPGTIGRLSTLKTLNLEYNRLTRFPKDLSKMVKLLSLSLHSNLFTQCPPSVVQLAGLKYLDLGNQSIATCELDQDVAATVAVPENETMVVLGCNPICSSQKARKSIVLGLRWFATCNASMSLPSILVNRGGTPASYNLGACEGDCDNDSHCAAGLKCFQRENREKIPGCREGGSGDTGHYDYCYDPAASDTGGTTCIACSAGKYQTAEGNCV